MLQSINCIANKTSNTLEFEEKEYELADNINHNVFITRYETHVIRLKGGTTVTIGGPHSRWEALTLQWT